MDVFPLLLSPVMSILDPRRTLKDSSEKVYMEPRSKQGLKKLTVNKKVATPRRLIGNEVHSEIGGLVGATFHAWVRQASESKLDDS